jgi:LAO/AO transport system kinase
VGTHDLATALRAGDRQALATAITLVESLRADDEPRAEALLQELLPHTGSALRIGVTGAPGVGKSTLIETIGTRLCARDRRVAVLAIDPSSTVTGGSILGDKTRMTALAREPNAFIRPSPGRGMPGGVGSRTREAILLCEAAGFGVVLVETVGTGQAETEVATMVDLVLLLLSPAGGDELQGIKRGVMELCDVVVVHKADGELVAAADRAAQQCLQALRVLRAGDPEPVPVLAVSSLTGAGIEELWQAIEDRAQARRQSGELERRRTRQAEQWLEAAMRDRLLAALYGEARVQQVLPGLRAEVAAGRLLPTAAARRLIGLRGGRAAT